MYGCEIWGFQSLEQIEVFYRKFLRNLLKVNKFTPNCIIYGEVGKSKLQTKVDSRMVLFWAKIVNSKNSKLSKTIYCMLKNMYDQNVYKSKWIVKVKNILDSCGFSFLWNESTVNTKWLKEALVLRLMDISRQQWHTEINENRLCDTYRIFKENLILEPYLSTLDLDYRLYLAKFRCGSHKLPISINKFSDQELSRLCNLCNLNELGDEFHYMFRWSLIIKDQVILK